MPAREIPGVRLYKFVRGGKSVVVTAPNKKPHGKGCGVVLSESTTRTERTSVKISGTEETIRKIIGSLPEQECFVQIEGSSKWPYIWQDKLTPALRICSKDPNPWGREWEIYLSVQTNKRNRTSASNSQTSTSRYPARLDLQLSPIAGESSQTARACLVREVGGGKVAYSSGKTLRFFVMEGKTQKLTVWVMLSVVERGEVEMGEMNGKTPTKNPRPNSNKAN